MTLAGATEVTGGVLLATGLATPVAVAGLTGVMITALRTAVWNDGVKIGGPGEFEVLLAVGAPAVAEEGPGRLSLDAALGQERSGPKWLLGALAAGAVGSELAIASARKQPPAGWPPAFVTVVSYPVPVKSVVTAPAVPLPTSLTAAA